MTILHDRYKVMHQGKEIAVNGSMPMTKPKPLIAPYKLPQDRLNIINKLWPGSLVGYCMLVRTAADYYNR